MCRDPLLTYLKDVGYSVVRLPRADIRPLQAFAGKGYELSRLGELATFLRPGKVVPLPAIRSDIPAATLSGKSTQEFKVGIGLSLLGGYLSAMGGGKIGLDAVYKQARCLSFEFDGVLEDSVEVAQLDRYLDDADLDPHAHYSEQVLESDEVYVVTATIKSRKFTVEAKADSGGGVDLNVPIIQGIIGGSVQVGRQANTSGRIWYEGQVPLVFGFQAVRLFFDHGQFTTMKPVDPGSVASRTAEDLQPVLLRASGAFVRLSS